MRAPTEFGRAAVDNHLKTKAAETEKVKERLRREEAERELRAMGEIFAQSAVPTALLRGPGASFRLRQSAFMSTRSAAPAIPGPNYSAGLSRVHRARLRNFWTRFT